MSTCDHLRKRYLLVILKDLIDQDPGESNSPQDVEMDDYNTPGDDYNTPGSDVASEASPSAQSSRKLSQADIELLAWALGSEQVVQDFQAMIDSVYGMEGKVDSITAKAFRSYEQARIHQTLRQKSFSDHRRSNRPWSLKDALQCFRADPPDVAEGNGPSPHVDTAMELDVALKLDAGGIGFEKLGKLRRDIAAFHIASLFAAMAQESSQKLKDKNRIDRHKDAPKPDGKRRGPVVTGRVYDELLRGCRSQDANTERSIKTAKRQGIHLLQYEEVCGREHPLWMLLPIRNIRLPGQGTARANHAK
jgi:hypothetical protein